METQELIELACAAIGEMYINNLIMQKRLAAAQQEIAELKAPQTGKSQGSAKAPGTPTEESSEA